MSRCGRRRRESEGRNGVGVGRYLSGAGCRCRRSCGLLGFARRQTIWTACGRQHEHGSERNCSRDGNHPHARRQPRPALRGRVIGDVRQPRKRRAAGQGQLGVNRGDHPHRQVLVERPGDRVEFGARADQVQALGLRTVPAESGAQPVDQAGAIAGNGGFGFDCAVTGVDDRKRDRLAVEDAYGSLLVPVGTRDTLRPRLVASVSGTDTTSSKPDSANAIRSDETSVST